MKSLKYMFVLAGLTLSFLHPLAVAQSGGTITFNDLTDTLSFSSTNLGARVSGSSCGVVQGVGWERCTLTLAFPVFPNGGTSWSNTDILDPFTGALSDTLVITPNLDPNFNVTSFLITFTSDAEGSAPLISSGGNRLFETGLVQTGSTISWANGVVVDTLNFQSDLESTPEPSSLLLLGSGLLGLVCVVSRRHADRL